MNSFKFFIQMSLVFIISLQSGITTAFAQSVNSNQQGDFWSEEVTASQRPRAAGRQTNPNTPASSQGSTSTVNISGPVNADGTRLVTQVEIPSVIDGERIIDGRQIEIQLEAGSNPMPTFAEMREAFNIYKEVAERNLMETFEKATTEMVAAPLRVLHRRYERAKATMREFPQEAFMFFWGMGAVTYFQMLWTAHKDPMVWEHFLEHQFSSVGAIGFWFFMYANRESAAMLNAAIYGRNYRNMVRQYRAQGLDNPENRAMQTMQMTGQVGRGPMFFSRFIPYLSMTAGFTAQNIVSTLIGDPDFQKCAMNSIRDTTAAAARWTARQAGVTVADTTTPERRDGFIPEPRTPAPATVAPGQDPCEKSYNWLVVRKKIYEAAPGLISMLGSTVISGLAEQPIYRMIGRNYGRATNAVAQMSRAATVRLLMGSTDRTAKIVLSGAVSLVINTAKRGNNLVLASAQTVSKLSNIILFTGIDIGGLNSFVTRRFRNGFEASHLGRRSSKMYEAIRHAKFSSWNPDSVKNLKLEVDKFAQASSEWRESQALDTMIAHSNWMTPMTEVMNRYNASKQFYQSMIEELTRYKRQTTPGQSKLDRDLGIYGMKPTLISGEMSAESPINPFAMEDIKEYYELSFPSIKNAYNVFNQALSAYSARQLTQNQSPGYQFIKSHADKLKPIIDRVTCDEMSSCQIPAVVDLRPIDQFVDQVSRLYYREFHYRDLAIYGYQVDFIETIKSAYSFLSLDQFDTEKPQNERNYVRPIPQLNKGYWYVRAVNDYNPMFKSFAEHTDLPNSVSGFRTRYKTDYFLLNMLCGPNIDKRQRLISIWEGFSPQFTPPSLVQNKPEICDLHLRQGLIASQNSPRTDYHPLQRQNNDENYMALLEYLKENIETKYLNLSDSSQRNHGQPAQQTNMISIANFNEFWEQKVFKQIEDILKFWVVKYDDVSAELLKSVNSNPQNWVNNIAIRQGGFIPGPFSTRIKEAASQELRLYVMLLGEVQKDLTLNQTPAAQPALIAYRTNESRHLSPRGWRDLMQSKYGSDRVGAPLFWHLREQDPLDFATIAAGFETPAHQQRLSQRTGNLEFQNEALSAFKDVTDLFSKFELVRLERNNPNSCWVFFNQSFMCRHWNALKDTLGLRSERFYEVKTNVSRQEEEAKLKAFDDKMKQIETSMIAQLSAENRPVRLTSEQKLFIEDLFKRSKSLGESMKHLLSMLRMNEIAAQINGTTEGRAQTQGPNGGSLIRGR
ncbi:MAG: hypothetical protein ACK5P5_02970 [Pseudobdellovibrionaceae bacterium]